MIIDLTIAFNAIHHFWDVAGVIFGGLLIVFVPVIILVASIMKIKDKLDNKT